MTVVRVSGRFAILLSASFVLQLAMVSTAAASTAIASAGPCTRTIASGGGFNLALKSDGTVSAWGFDSLGQLGGGSIPTGPDATAVGQPLEVVSSSGSGALTGVVSLAAGEAHSLALTHDGTVYAWGDNSVGELGTGTTNTGGNPTPTLVLSADGSTPLTGIVKVAAGGVHSLALATDGTVWAWGGNYKGELGIGSTTNSALPVKVPGLSDVVSIAAGLEHSLALRADGTVWGWGWNAEGQLGNGTTTDSLSPVQTQNLNGVVALYTGESHSFGVRADGGVWAWGLNSWGELGTGSASALNQGLSLPVQVAALQGMVAFAAGNTYSLGLKPDGTVWAWGDDSFGSLGNGVDYGTSMTPVQVPSLHATAVSASDNQSLALAPDGTASAWGFNDDAQLGQGPGNIGGDSPTPLQVQSAPGIALGGIAMPTVCPQPIAVPCSTRTISAGGFYSLAVRPDGTVWSWGDNSGGELGRDTGLDQYGNPNSDPTPAQVKGLPAVVQVAAAKTFNLRVHSLALAADGSVWAWGDNGYGELGVDPTTGLGQSLTPVEVPGVSNAVDIAAGIESSLAVEADGTVWGWGMNEYGEARGTIIADSGGIAPPGPVAGLSDVKQVAMGRAFSLALKNDGTVWAWGYNQYGELGNGGIANNPTPSQVQGLPPIVAITAGIDHALALAANGTVWGWGINQYGELGDGSAATGASGQGVPSPVQVLTLDHVVAIAAGVSTSFAVTADGSTWAWGQNLNGDLGNGSGPYADEYLPVRVSTIGSTAELAAGWNHVLALQRNGTLWGWGDDFSGELGLGSLQTAPVAAPIALPFTGIAVPGGLCLSGAGAVSLPKLSLTLDAPASVQFADRSSPVPLTVTATLVNSGAGPATGIDAGIALPPNLVLAAGVANNQHIASLAAGQSQTLSWTLNAVPPQYTARATVTVDVMAQNAPELAQSQDISLPGMAPILFVHGINGNAADLRAGHGWNALLDPLRARYGASNVVIFDYYQDFGYALNGSGTVCQTQPGPDANIGQLYLDPNYLDPNYCDSKSALAVDAAMLDDELQSMPPHTAVIANSLGGAITRGWMTLAQQRNAQAPDSSLAAVDTVVFLQGAAQGSYLGAIGEMVNSTGTSSPNVSTVVMTVLASQVAAKLNFDPNRPGVIDVSGDSLYYRSTNPTAVPPNIHYFTFYTDIHVTNVRYNFIFGSIPVPLPPNRLSFGDTVMLPGTSSPTDHKWYGGARFLPPPAAGYQRREFRVDVPVTFNFSSTPGTQGIDVAAFIASLIAEPASHFHFGDDMNSPDLFTIPDCNGSGPVTPTQQVIQALDAPSHACG